MIKWHGIDYAPKDGTVVFLFSPQLKTPVVGSWHKREHIDNGVVTFSTEGWVARGLFPSMTELKPTHWMPIPPAPEHEGE